MEWECDAVLKDFSWGVADHDKDGLRVRLEFEKPAELSYSAPDRVIIRVKDPPLLVVFSDFVIGVFYMFLNKCCNV